ncbi:MAG: UvrD-helicase domain-containing protein, partial [Gemmatimonadetes bacterium]|nr:UvrD-helicase domain-containing protein [Gemmatimonadota bacterium]
MTEPVRREPADRTERDVIRRNLDETLVVEASAGTGKTTALVGRIVEVLAEGRAKVDRIVAVTFTEKAAGELKLRLRSGLEKARGEAVAGGPRAKNLTEALSRLEEARVGTIHGFCADLLRERSIEAGVDPRFESMTEPEAQRLYEEAFGLWLQERLENPPEGVRRSLRREARRDEGPIARLRSAGWTLVEWRDFPGAWERRPFAREERVDGLVERLHEFADLTANCERPARDNLFLDTEPARRLSREVRTAEDVRDRDYDGLEARLVALLSYRFRRVRKGSGKRYGENLPRENVLAAHGEFVRELETFANDADADLAALLHGELFETIERYELLKQRRGRVDFLDLLLATRNLVRDNREVRAGFQRRFERVFVDEFQDTDPLQAEILLLLAAADSAVDDWRVVVPAPGKLFLVGDPKQSIYRFRRADIGVYFEVREQLVANGARVVRLTTSFRSSPRIQRVVNAAFESALDGDREAQQADWAPLFPHRDDPAEQPSVVALPVPSPYGGWGRVTKTAIDGSLPDAVAAFVHWLLTESGWTVTERDRDERVPIAPRHVCLLFRRMESWGGDVTRGYVDALEARG